MSAPQSLQDRILDALREAGPIAARDISNWFGDVDRIDLDTTLTRLMRQNSVSLTLGKYDLVAQKPTGQRKPFVATPVDEPVSQMGCNRDAPPSASEKAAASLSPAEPETSYCLKCDQTKPVSEFQRSRYGKIWSTCKSCQGKAVTAGIAASKSVGLERSEGNPSLTVQSKLGSGIPAETSGSTSENPPSNSSPHTPPPPQPGSKEPPATSSEHPSVPLAQGTRTPSISPREPEALSPVGTGTSAVMLLQLAEKRRRWVTEIAALELAITRVDELVAALQALEQR